MIVYEKLLVQIGELYDEDTPAGAQVDIVRYRERCNLLENCHCTPFSTVWIDLSRSSEELFGAMKKGTRYEIRLAESRDRLSAQNFDAGQPGVLREFCEFYNAFAGSKGLAHANRAKLSALASANRLWLSRAAGPDGSPLVWHAYIWQGRRARLLHSASLIRNSEAGRANRFLHWQDMLALKGRDTPILDLGGWYSGSTDEDKLRINQFKAEFGGAIVKTFNCERALTMRGRLALAAWRLFNRQEA